MARGSRDSTGPSGLLVVDKPAGLTSHDVVARTRRLAGTRRVGHAGTLDPMATGVLILGINQATKLLTWITGETKSYDAVIRLGFSTVTDDAEGETTATAPAGAVEALEDAAVDAAVAGLTGDIEQVPSAVSAIKVDGKRSYARVRSGEQVALSARPVRIDEFTVHERVRTTSANGAPVLDLSVSVSCSSGTYIRALARDLGAALGVGGHLTALRRTRIGQVGLADVATLEELSARREAGQGLPLLPLQEAARRLFRERRLTGAEATDVSNGRWITPSGTRPEGQAPAPAESERVSTGAGEGIVPAAALSAGFAPDGTLVALLQDQRRRVREVAVPHLVFASGQRFDGPETGSGTGPDAGASAAAGEGAA